MDGILLFNKPILWTSHDAVDFIRLRIGQRSAGHAGTLDPLATGLLVLLLGNATKRSEEFSRLDKEYWGALTLGVSTDTQDLEGRILNFSPQAAVSEEELRAVFSRFTGVQWQIPPAYSAARQKGRKMYEWTRRGVAVEASPKEITISEWHLTRYDPPDAHFFLRCSKGTYVRTLCDLAGKELGCGAVLSALVRTRVGKFLLDKAVTEEEARRLPLEQLEKRLHAGA